MAATVSMVTEMYMQYSQPFWPVFYCYITISSYLFLFSKIGHVLDPI